MKDLSRRNFLQTAGTLAATVYVASKFGSVTAKAASIDDTSTSAKPIMRKIPKTGEMIPAIGLGTFMTFDVLPGQDKSSRQEVLKRFYDGGGRVTDTSPLYGASEIVLGESVNALGLNDKLFMTNKVWSTGEYLGDESHALHSLTQSQQRLWREKLDVVQVHSLVNVDIMVPFLNKMKKEGRIRYVGVTHHDPDYFVPLEKWVKSGHVDFVQVHYSMATRVAEERILPAALDNGVAVLLNMPLEKAKLHKAVAGQKLPEFAKDIGAQNWSQYFLKWAISHPAVTCALPATTNPEHQTENIGALYGPLPDAAFRDRMVKHLETISGFQKIGKMPWYPDKKFSGMVHLS